MSKFSEYIKRLRKEKNLTQQALADALQVSVSSIKRIEAGKSDTPNSRLLQDLAGFTNQSIVDVMEDIFFLDNKKREESRFDFGFKFLSYMYLNGWNFEPLKVFKYPDSEILDVYVGLLTKKRQSMKCFVKMLADYPEIYKTKEPERIRQFIFDQIIFSTSIKELKEVNNYIYLCNNGVRDELDAYNILKTFHFAGIKLNIKVVLYDAVKNEVINQSQATGFDFNLRG